MAEPRKNVLNLSQQLPASSRARISLLLSVLCVSSLYYYFGYSSNPQNFLRRRHHDVFLSSATNSTLSSYLRALTLHPHLAGTKPSLQTSLYVETHFRELGFDTCVKEYNVLLSYPKHSSLSAHFSNGAVRDFSLTDYDGEEGLVRPYHAYSPSGTAYGEVVFVNYGREEDYGALGTGVKVKGSIVLARRGDGSPSRGAVVNKAAERGAAAVLMYTEGAEDRGVERGTVMVNNLGDPLSPGWGAAEGVRIESERLGMEDGDVAKWFPKIPSLPISANVAHEILGCLLKEWNSNKVPLEWRGTLKVRAVPVGIWSGPVMFNFSYQGEKKMETIRNVFAVVKGLEEPDRFVVLGNHRDAWTYGAVDPNSGTAALLDIARRYALMMRMGWNPRRTIILSSWDAEEFGMIGSTEWVEENLLNLKSKAVAYLNVDCAVQGPGFFAGSTPQLDDLLVEITKKVKDPDTDDVTINEKWITKDMRINIQRLSRVDSDFAPFLQHAGIPSVDLYYGKDFPVYHTAFDSYSWMTKYGDPFFQRHVAVAGVWGLLALHLSDDPILPFNYLSYAAKLQEYTDVLSDIVGGHISLHPLSMSVQKFVAIARETQTEAQKLREQKTMSEIQVLERRRLNDRLMLAERGFIDTDGLQGRTWFKHLIYGPPGNNKSKLDFFPGIAEALSHSSSMSKNQSQAAMLQHEVWRVARAIQRAASALKGEFI